MSLQNRIRAIVAVVMLLGAFMIFVPHNGPGSNDAEAPAQDSEKTQESTENSLAWHGKPSDKPQAKEVDGRGSAKTTNIRPLFFPNSQLDLSDSDVETGTNPVIASTQIQNQYRPLLPFQINRPLKVDDADLIPIEPKSFDSTFDHSVGDTISHRIEFGETLQSISERYYGTPNEYLRIYEFNRDVLDEPIHLPAGVKIEIPRGS